MATLTLNPAAAPGDLPFGGLTFLLDPGEVPGGEEPGGGISVPGLLPVWPLLPGAPPGLLPWGGVLFAPVDPVEPPPAPTVYDGPDVVARRLLRTRLLSIADLPGAKVWENAGATPPTTGPYLGDAMMVPRDGRTGMGTTYRLWHDVVYLVTLAYPVGSGSLAMETAAALLRATFLRGTQLIEEPYTLTVLSIERGIAPPDPRWVRVPFTLSCRLSRTVTA